MISVDNSDIIEQRDSVIHAYSSSAGAPFFGVDYLKTAFPRLEERSNREMLSLLQKADPLKTSVYPYQVKIPKSLRELIDGDYEPAKVLTITEPFKGPHCNLWFGNTLRGINLRWGFINGDSRKIGNHALDDATVHCFVAGATGQGKSVTINAIIYNCCAEYPPWELKLTLSDAKIVEFKSIAISHPMPQIDIVAATPDTDYLLSMLNDKYEEMMLRQTMFTKAGEYFKTGIKNIKEFREVTGLTLPRQMMLFDECTAMFQTAGKRASAIAEIIDKIARLGRNVGFHLLMDSQEVSSDLPDKTLANMTLRGAMGCTAKVSEKVIGNDGAVLNLGKKGRLLVNQNSEEKNNISKNVLIRVPYYTEDQINEVADSVISLGKMTGMGYQLQFYDEQEKILEEDFKKYHKSFRYDKNRIVLGPPSFIMHDDEPTVKIRVGIDDMENISVFANNLKSKQRALIALKTNLCTTDENTHLVMCVDQMYVREDLVDGLNAYMYREERGFENSEIISVTRSVVYRRMLCSKTDARVFKNPTFSDAINEVFHTYFEEGSEYDTELNKSRFDHYLYFLKEDPEIVKGFGTSGNDEKTRKRRADVAASCIKLCHQYGCSKTPMVKEKYNNVWVWVLGMEKLLGIGRDTKSKFVESLKQLMQDCTSSNVRFITFTSTYEDLKPIANATTFFLCDDLSPAQASQMGARDLYPENLAPQLMLLIKPMEPLQELKVQKFKKIMLAGEQ